MLSPEPQETGGREVSEVTTFPVLFDLEEIKENISISTNTPTKPSKEQLIKQAFKLHSQGNILEASKYYQYCLDKGFNDQRIFSNYGIILKSIGKVNEAEIFYRKAIKLNPNFADAHSNLGNLLKDLGKLKEAEISYRKAIKLNPNFADAHSNLGNTLKDLGQLKEAEISYRKAIKLNPNFAKAHYNLGIILRDIGKLKEAEISYRKAIELNPNFADAYSNLGNTLKDLGKLKEAEISYRKAIELNPNFAEACYGLSIIELLNGDYQSGLDNYEFRFKAKKAVVPHGTTALKRIDNHKLKKRDKLLVISEQGLGDTLQYMRYVPYLRELGLDVSFSAQTKLHSLIKASNIDSNPLPPEQTSLISDGKWIPLLSLPRYLKVNPKNPIITKPYIYSTDELNQKWKNILSKEKKPIIGINWQGNPDIERNIYPQRSLPLELFSNLAQHNEVSILYLQKGFGLEQLEQCSFKNKFIKCQSVINSTWDFLENAAIIKNCDLIITCDTSIAHLAGGMGKKVWLLLKDIAYWTWGLKADNTFWYPSMRLFRQKERNNWNEVMSRVSYQINAEIYK